MAEIKVVNLQVNTNIDTASKDFEDLAKSIKVVDKAANNLDATFEEVYGDLQPLTTRMGEAEDRLYELALAGQQSSQEFKDLLASVANYRKTQIQTDMVVDAAATTLGQKLTGSLNAAAGAFSLVQGSMALFGAESDDVEQAILKVQSAMAISQGVETIAEGAKSVRALGTAIQATTVFQKASAAAQYVWNAAMAANPIGVVVASITALLVGGYKLIKFFKDSSDANEKAANATRKNTAALKEQSITAAQSSNKLKTYNDQQYALAQASGASGEELRKLALKHKEEEIALNKKNAILAQSTFLRERDTLAALKNSDASDEVIANQEKLTQETYKAFKRQNEILSNSYKERAALRNSNRVAEVADAKSEAERVAERAKEVREKAAQRAKEAEEKRIQERKDYIAKGISEEDEVQAAKDALIAKQEKDKQDRFLKDIAQNAAVQKKKTDDLAMQEAAQTLIAKLNYEERISYAIQASNTLSQLSDLAGKQTIAGKALGIATATINTYIGVSEVLKQKSTLPSPFDVVAKVANVATVLATGFKAVKAITSVKVPGGGGGGFASTPMSVSGASAATTAPIAPTFNVVGTSGQNQIAQTLGNQRPVRAFVVSNDVSTAQALDRNIVKTATLGN
jgi:hypothetical protein